MDFYEVLAKVIELLQREGRASYRALKRQFDLDDEYIEDLKDASSMRILWSTMAEGSPGLVKPKLHTSQRPPLRHQLSWKSRMKLNPPKPNHFPPSLLLPTPSAASSP